MDQQKVCNIHASFSTFFFLNVTISVLFSFLSFFLFFFFLFFFFFRLWSPYDDGSIRKTGSVEAALRDGDVARDVDR